MCNSRTYSKVTHHDEGMRKVATSVLLLPPPSALHRGKVTSSHKNEMGESSLPTENIQDGVGSNEDHATFPLHDEALMKHCSRAVVFLHNVKQKLMVGSKIETSGLDDSHSRKIGGVEALSFDTDEPTDETFPDDDSLTQEDNNDVIDSQEGLFHSTGEVQSNTSHPVSSLRIGAPAIEKNPLDICISVPPCNSSSSDVPILRSCFKHDYSPLQHELNDLPKSVRFGHIEIREYHRALVDNPAVSEGPPIGLSWEYDPHETKVKVEDYERLRPTRRVKEEFLIPARLREEMLIKEWGHTMREIRQASLEAKQRMYRRQKALRTSKATEKLTEVLESSRRKFHRLKTGTTKAMEQENLWKEASKWLDTSDES